MKRRMVAVLSCCAVAAWSWSRPVAAAPEPQDTTLPGVIARVQFASSGDGVLRVGIVFHNDNDHAADAGGRPFRFADFTMVDAKANRKSFAIKDANGKYVAGPVSDWNDGGRWFAAVAAKSETLVWAWFEDVAPGTKIALQVPLVGEMDVVVAPRVAVPPT
ncbi:MAG TPA: hypothetical protein VH375_01460, partial [Rhodanobacteraceae bacterium]